jgi:hypothetical protein
MLKPEFDALKPLLLPKLVICFGESGSGKSEFQRILESCLNFSWIHPINDFKQFLERKFGLQKGAMHTPEGKATKFEFNELFPKDVETHLYWFLADHYDISGLETPDCVNGTGKTLGTITKLMVDRIFTQAKTLGEIETLAWKEMKNIDPHFSLPYVRRELARLLREGKDVVMLAIRNQHEQVLIQEVMEQGNCIPYLVKINRPGYEGLSTDVEQVGMFNALHGVVPEIQIHLVTNDFPTLAEWKAECYGLGYNMKYSMGLPGLTLS